MVQTNLFLSSVNAGINARVNTDIQYEWALKFPAIYLVNHFTSPFVLMETKCGSITKNVLFLSLVLSKDSMGNLLSVMDGNG